MLVIGLFQGISKSFIILTISNTINSKEAESENSKSKQSSNLSKDK